MILPPLVSFFENNSVENLLTRYWPYEPYPNSLFFFFLCEHVVEEFDATGL